MLAPLVSFVVGNSVVRGALLTYSAVRRREELHLEGREATAQMLYGIATQTVRSAELDKKGVERCTSLDVVVSAAVTEHRTKVDGRLRFPLTRLLPAPQQQQFQENKKEFTSISTTSGPVTSTMDLIYQPHLKVPCSGRWRSCTGRAESYGFC